jgi:hypothetical protein
MLAVSAMIAIFLVVAQLYNVTGPYGKIIETHPNKIASLDGALTIVIDEAGSCPKGCAFIHYLLPDTLRYRYSEIGGLNDADEHLLLVGRSPLGKKEYQALVDRQRQRNLSIGLFFMADEHYDKTSYLYFQKYDYVLRHYYDSHANTRALGNLSCGSSILPDLPSTKMPKWGIHWVFLSTGPSLGLPNLSSTRKAESVWPSNKRPINCSFIGRGTEARYYMSEAFRIHGSDLMCKIKFTNGFKQGDDPWDYIVKSLTLSKIGLNPTGNNAECHRLAELLENGVIPAMIDGNSTDFLHAAFQRLPAVTGSTWDQVIHEMRELISNSSKLNKLQMETTQFYSKLKQCMKQDLEFILSSVFKAQ